MTRNKKLIVPQEGTQPATMPSPIDNMFQGTIPQKQKSTASTGKKGTTFSLDPELCNRFKAICAQQGRSMSSVIEDFILGYVSKQ